MNKLNLGIILLAMLLSTTSVLAENRAVEISIGGIGPAVDAAAFGTVRQVIGHAVANGVVDKFIVTGYGIEGGFSACAQASQRTKAFPSFIRHLRTIVPNPGTTAYSLQPVAACTNNMTVCSQDVKLCPDGSYVSRIAPSCQFALCPVKQ